MVGQPTYDDNEKLYLNLQILTRNSVAYLTDDDTENGKLTYR